jgi:hypothetical protein
MLTVIRTDMIPLGSLTFFAPTIVNGLGKLVLVLPTAIF